jgi:CHAT domain-containing protein
VDHEIVYEPSASALAFVLNDQTRREATNTVAVFANPVFEADDSRVTKKNGGGANASTEQATVRGVFRDLGLSNGRIPSLPASREEAEAILSMAPRGTGLRALGFEANRAAITHPDLAQYRIVHFATHGFVDYEHPELSGLVLSLVDQNGQPQDGYLRLHDIYNLRLSADLVVLSACNTGLGKEIKGEGLIGLTRGFMYAGAGGVAASLWKVDDEATAELMAKFYEGMFKKGLTPAASMRDAQLWMWQQKRWQSPYYWAAFILQGRYDQVQNAGFQSSRAQALVLFAGVASAVLLMACLAWGRRRTRNV